MNIGRMGHGGGVPQKLLPEWAENTKMIVRIQNSPMTLIQCLNGFDLAPITLIVKSLL